jgi:hypothetical protein
MKFEYKEVVFTAVDSGMATETLNGYAHKGWELVAINIEGQKRRAWLKRAIA